MVPTLLLTRGSVHKSCQLYPLQWSTQGSGSTGQPATDVKRLATSITGSDTPAEDLVSDTEQLSDHVSASPVDEEDEVSDLESADGSIESRSRRTVRCGPRTEC